MLDTTGAGARITRRAVLAVLALLGGTLATAGLPAPAGRTNGSGTEGMAGLARRAGPEASR